MTHWPPLLFWEAELAKKDAGLAESPGDTGLLFERAIILSELGRTEEAKHTYIGILTQNPSHFGALNNLGALLMASGFTAAAVTTYTEAVRLHPDNPKGHANLADTLFQKGEGERALHHFSKALELDPNYTTAHQGIAYILREKGFEQEAREHRRKGFAGSHTLVLPYRGTGSPVVLLLFASAMGGMIPLRQHLDHRIFHTTVIFVEFYPPDEPLPPHQIIFNGIGDADLCQPDFDAALRLLEKTTAPVINHPGAVRVTGRAGNAKRLGKLEEVITPKTALLPRSALVADELERHGFPFPLVLRRPGFHTGQYFMKAENPGELAAALAAIPGGELLVMQYVDSRNRDGKIRKYRVMMIDGQLYPLHAAVSREWKVHYFTAEMAQSAEHRAEDAAFLQDMPKVLGERAMNALGRIQSALALDYAGVDFGLDAQGRIILFEANATMTVNPPDRDAKWDYRRPAVARIQQAIRTMLMRRV